MQGVKKSVKYLGLAKGILDFESATLWQLCIVIITTVVCTFLDVMRVGIESYSTQIIKNTFEELCFLGCIVLIFIILRELLNADIDTHYNVKDFSLEEKMLISMLGYKFYLCFMIMALCILAVKNLKVNDMQSYLSTIVGVSVYTMFGIKQRWCLLTRKD